MRKDMLVQFVCFETKIDTGEFLQQWERLMNGITGKNKLPEVINKAITKTRFNYISKHQWPQDDFQFVFKKNRRGTERFAESRVRVVQAGGYVPVQIEHEQNEDDDICNIIIFNSSHETDFNVFKKLESKQKVNIYQAFYENCMYGSIIEYFISKEEAPALHEELKTKFPDLEIVTYEDCPLPVA
ncbi:MAG: hypothetical protein ABIR18_11995 [Chitinophagaceae bacterium]